MKYPISVIEGFLAIVLLIYAFFIIKKVGKK